MSKPQAAKDDSSTSAPSSYRLVIRVDLGPDGANQTLQPRRTERRTLVLVLAAIAIAVVGIGIKLFSAERAPASTPASTVAAPAVYETPLREPAPPPPSIEPSSINQEIPDVPQRSLDTIHGTVRVVIRVNVDKDGKVVRAIAQDPGPSRYFERLALDASKKWTFEPAASDAEQVRLVRFNFRRSGTTATAEEVPGP